MAVPRSAPGCPRHRHVPCPRLPRTSARSSWWLEEELGVLAVRREEQATGPAVTGVDLESSWSRVACGVLLTLFEQLLQPPLPLILVLDRLQFPLDVGEVVLLHPEQVGPVQAGRPGGRRPCLEGLDDLPARLDNGASDTATPPRVGDSRPSTPAPTGSSRLSPLSNPSAGRDKADQGADRPAPPRRCCAAEQT